MISLDNLADEGVEGNGCVHVCACVCVCVGWWPCASLLSVHMSGCRRLCKTLHAKCIEIGHGDA